MRLRVHRDGRWAALFKCEIAHAEDWFVLEFSPDPWLTDDEVHQPDWSEVVVLVPGPEAGVRLAAALAAAHGVDTIDVSEPDVLADALRRIAERTEHDACEVDR